MKRKTTLAVAVAVAIGTLSTAAFAVTPFGNNSQKGSLLIFARVDIRAGNDTLITMTNDSTQSVRMKCYYATSQQFPTPYTGTPASRTFKWAKDFQVDFTHNQVISWWAGTGKQAGGSKQIAPPFGHFNQPANVTLDAGELKCWAQTNDGQAQLSYNHMFGTASVINASTAQAYEYTASAFQALSPTNTVLPLPGVLFLDNIQYDACPNMLMGNYNPGGRGPAGPQTQVTLASCNQDLRQNYSPTVTKLTWTFWSQDESPRTGNHYCADSWYETSFPSSDPLWYDSTYDSLGTESAYFRIETTADTSICAAAVTSSYVGVISRNLGTSGQTRGTNLTQRGTVAGVIKYDLLTGDGFQQ